MRRIISLVLLLLLTTSNLVWAQNDPYCFVRDIASLEGIRDNHLVGYGVVVGLEGTGDSSRSEPTMQSITNMLRHFGIDVPEGTLRLRNAAAVMLTATLAPFTSPGERIDVLVSSLGDARSLEGGVLLLSPLRAGNGDVYAMAQGPMSLGGIGAGAAARDSIQHNTAGIIPGGALVEVNVDYDWHDGQEIRLRLREGSFGTSSRLAEAINKALAKDGNNPLAKALDPSRIQVRIPDYAKDQPVDFVASIYNLQVQVDVPAKVVINERTGTVVIGHGVRISTVAVAHEGMRIKIGGASLEGEGEGPSFASNSQEVSMAVLEGGATVMDLVQGLNALGAKPADIISILLAIQRMGALHAILEVI